MNRVRSGFVVFKMIKSYVLGLNPGRGVSKRRKIDKVTYSERYKKPVRCMKNKRVVNMSGVKIREEWKRKRPRRKERASHFRVGLATDLKRCLKLSRFHDQVSHKKTSECGGFFFFPGRLATTLRLRAHVPGSFRKRSFSTPDT